MMSKRFVFLDRDGTLNRECEYLSHPDQVELLPGVVTGLQKMRSMGLGLAIVTNQSGVARGYFNLVTLDRIHARLLGLLAEQGVEIDGIYVCPHLPDENCGCRKPMTGLAYAAVSELGMNLQDCFVIGDKPCDINLGKAIAATTLLVKTGYGARYAQDPLLGADYIVNDLSAAADTIQRLITRTPEPPAPHFLHSRTIRRSVYESAD